MTVTFPFYKWANQIWALQLTLILELFQLKWKVSWLVLNGPIRHLGLKVLSGLQGGSLKSIYCREITREKALIGQPSKRKHSLEHFQRGISRTSKEREESSRCPPWDLWVFHRLLDLQTFLNPIRDLATAPGSSPTLTSPARSTLGFDPVSQRAVHCWYMPTAHRELVTASPAPYPGAIESITIWFSTGPCLQTVDVSSCSFTSSSMSNQLWGLPDTADTICGETARPYGIRNSFLFPNLLFAK